MLRRKKVVATLSTMRSKAGRASLTWNGRSKGKLARRGTYRIVARAVLDRRLGTQHGLGAHRLSIPAGVPAHADRPSRLVDPHGSRMTAYIEAARPIDVERRMTAISVAA